MACKPDGRHCERCGHCAYRCPQTALESLRTQDPVFYGWLLGNGPTKAQNGSQDSGGDDD